MNLLRQVPTSRIVFIIFCLALLPLSMQGRINFGALVLEGEHDLFCFRNDAKLRRALLVTNGKEWFIDNVIKPIGHTAQVNLGFIQGDYSIIANRSKGDAKRDEFAIGIKKAIDYLSANNDTLYQIFQGGMGIDPTLPDHVLMKPIPQPVIAVPTTTYMANWRYNFDQFDFFRYTKPLVYIICHGWVYNISRVESYLCEMVFPKDVTHEGIVALLNDYMNFCGDLPDEKIEKLYQLINSFDDYVLSLPFTLRPYQLELLEWGYTPDKHLRPGDVPDFMKEEGIVEK